METIIQTVKDENVVLAPSYLNPVQKNEQVDLLFTLMGNPDKEQEFKDLLLEITRDCRLFANHLELEMAEHMANPEVFTMDDVKASCRQFRRESISNLFGSVSRKIQEYKQKDHKKAMECLKYAEGLFASVKAKAVNVVEKVKSSESSDDSSN